MSDQKRERKILLMFHGERVDWRRKIYQLFKDKAGEEYVFTGIRNISFGDIAPMVDKKMSRRPKLIEETGWVPTEKETFEYEAQKLVVRQMRQSKLDAFKLTRPHKDVTRAVDLLRPFYKALTDVDRNRFMMWVGNECSKKK